ncbi:MAG: hypothetical protein H6591_10190 [Flavobacteriales bacterium]|nr:hypothetical protein [Flavobacteriales bacterium]
MKRLYSLFLLLPICSALHAQCEFVSIQVSSSDTSLVNLYQAGFFLLDSGYANVCVWEVNTFDGGIVHQDTTSGPFPEQAFTGFAHSVPLTDSMAVSLVITNTVTGSVCAIQDTLVWIEEEPIPGFPFGSWNVTGQNGGIVTGVAEGPETADAAFTLFPSPATDQVRIDGVPSGSTCTIADAQSRTVRVFMLQDSTERIDVSTFIPGLYLMTLRDARGVLIGIRRFVRG